MSIVRSDNRLENHGKPVQEYERKLSSGSYVDWASTAELNAAYNVAFRKNKHFWIAGIYYGCDNDGTTYRSIGGAVSMLTTICQTVGASGLTVTVATLIGKSVKLILRGGIGSGEILTVGSVSGNKVRFDNTTGDLTVAVDNEWFADEELTIQYI